MQMEKQYSKDSCRSVTKQAITEVAANHEALNLHLNLGRQQLVSESRDKKGPGKYRLR